MNKSLASIENKIAKLKEKIAGIGDMRPGSLSQQFKNPKDKQGGFWQLNSTFLGKTSTEYVRKDSLAFIRAELKEYLRFRRLADQLVAENIKRSRLKMKLAKTKKAGSDPGGGEKTRN